MAPIWIRWRVQTFWTNLFNRARISCPVLARKSNPQWRGRCCARSRASREEMPGDSAMWPHKKSTLTSDQELNGVQFNSFNQHAFNGYSGFGTSRDSVTTWRFNFRGPAAKRNPRIEFPRPAKVGGGRRLAHGRHE